MGSYTYNILVHACYHVTIFDIVGSTSHGPEGDDVTMDTTNQTCGMYLLWVAIKLFHANN